MWGGDVDNNEFSSRVKQLFDYNPEDGSLKWKIQRRGRARKGSKAGTVHPKGYIRISVDNIDYLAHRIIWILVNGNIPENSVVDHINGIPSDNRLSNLRLTTAQGNVHNQVDAHKGNASKLIGASFNKPTGKWLSRIKLNGKDKYIGLFETPEEAHEAYMKHKKLMHPTLRKQKSNS